MILLVPWMLTVSFEQLAACSIASTQDDVSNSHSAQKCVPLLGMGFPLLCCCSDMLRAMPTALAKYLWLEHLLHMREVWGSIPIVTGLRSDDTMCTCSHFDWCSAYLEWNTWEIRLWPHLGSTKRTTMGFTAQDWVWFLADRFAIEAGWNRWKTLFQEFHPRRAKHQAGENLAPIRKPVDTWWNRVSNPAHTKCEANAPSQVHHFDRCSIGRPMWYSSILTFPIS